MNDHLVFHTHSEAEHAIKLLINADFDLKKVSIIGKGYHTEEHPIGFYTQGEKIRAWGSNGAFWGGLWGLLFLPAIFFIPGYGVLAMAGPIATILISTLEGAVLGGSISAIGAALSQIGVPNHSVLKFETAIKADKFVLLIHGDDQDQLKASAILAQTKLLA